MNQFNYPIPTGWKLFARHCWRRLRAEIESPWTKITVLAVLFVVINNGFSFSVSFDGTGIEAGKGSVFTSLSTSTPRPQLMSFSPAAREWTDKQLRQLAYVKQYQDAVLEESRRHNIPASITMAQALLESGTGRSTLATRNNNHFGIKCFSKKCAKGHCSNHSDDHHKDFFRNYASPVESFRDHSEVLQKERYRKLFKLSPTDYRGWARGLSKAGYATDPRYADKLIRMIEDLGLDQLDRLTP